MSEAGRGAGYSGRSASVVETACRCQLGECRVGCQSATAESVTSGCQCLAATPLQSQSNTGITNEGCAKKTKIGSDSVFKNRTIQRFDIRSDGFPIKTACNAPFK